MMSLNIIGHCTNILEEMWFSSPPETSAEPYFLYTVGDYYDILSCRIAAVPWDCCFIFTGN